MLKLWRTPRPHDPFGLAIQPKPDHYLYLLWYNNRTNEKICFLTKISFERKAFDVEFAGIHNNRHGLAIQHTWLMTSGHALPLLLDIYQPVLPHRLIRVILKINHISNNYNYLSHALPSIKYSNTYYKIYIYHNKVAINFILHHTSMCVWYIYLIKLFIYELVFLSLSSYMNIQWYLSWVVFIYV